MAVEPSTTNRVVDGSETSSNQPVLAIVECWICEWKGLGQSGIELQAQRGSKRNESASYKSCHLAVRCCGPRLDVCAQLVQ